MKKHLLYFSLLFAVSCTPNSKPSLSGDGYRVWLIFVDNSKLPSDALYFRYFDDLGNCNSVCRGRGEGDYALCQGGGDNVIVPTWGQINDTTATVWGNSYHVNFFGNDRFILTDVGGSYTIEGLAAGQSFTDSVRNFLIREGELQL